MKRTLVGTLVVAVIVATVAVTGGSSVAANTKHCYVTGDTSGNKPANPPGSRQNPYGSLSAVEADLACETITVLHSANPLDGGIALRDGQKLTGQKGPGGALPSITNSSDATNEGNGVVLASDNTIEKLHILDTYASAIAGADVGTLIVRNNTITGFGQSGDPSFAFAGVKLVPPGMALLQDGDADIVIIGNTIGDADTTSIAIGVLGGIVGVSIRNTDIANQGHLAVADISPGAVVSGVGDSTVDVVVRNTSVSNIGSGLSNSDGLAVIARDEATVRVDVEDYRYSNPDGDGNFSATGIEMGTIAGTGATFQGSVRNSTFDGGSTSAIQVVDAFAFAPGSNTLTVEIEGNLIRSPRAHGIELISIFVPGPVGTASYDVRDNEIIDAGMSGIAVIADTASRSSITATIEDNRVRAARADGILVLSAASGCFGVCGPTQLDVALAGNTVADSTASGLAFRQLTQAPLGSVSLDAGGGALGSAGGNRIINSVAADILSDGFDVVAENDWWGSPAGPAVVLLLNGGTVDYLPLLTADPI